MDVVISDEGVYREKLRKIREGGVDHLQIVADFDYTLTVFRLPDGKRSDSSHAAIAKCKALGEDFNAKTQALFEKYYPIEVSDIPNDEKEKHMIAWWSQSHDLMVSYSLHRDHIEELTANANIVLRSGVRDMLETAQSHHIPVHILSAGVYDVIHIYLRQKGLDGYAHVVSNMMDFDEESGALKGFKGELIHTLNKNSVVLQSSPQWDEVKARRSVILLGDNIGDVQMAHGLNAETVLNIGFLNDRVEERLAEYKEQYDVVLIGDSGVEDVNRIIADIISAES